MNVDVLLCKKGEKVENARRGGKKIAIAVQHVVSYTVPSSMTAGNAGLDVALCVCVRVFE